MKSKEIRELSSKEIQVKINEFRAELLNLILRKTTGQMEKPHLIKEKRRTIARLETILNSKMTEDSLKAA